MTEKEMIWVAVTSVLFAIFYDTVFCGGEICRCFVVWLLELLPL